MITSECHPHVTRLYSYLICMSLACTRISSVCTRLWFYHEPCIIWENVICIICIYLPEIDTFIGMMFPTVHHREVPYVQGNPHYYPGDILSITISITIFSQLNSGFISHTHKHTHHWKFHWTFVSQTRSLASSKIWRTWVSDKKQS